MKTDYDSVLKLFGSVPKEAMIQFASEKLPQFWRDAYNQTTLRTTDLVFIQHKTFQYLYDLFPVLQREDEGSNDTADIEPRVVVAFGCSSPQELARDDYRLKGWVGKTEKAFGKHWDKGHFIAHSLGDAVDGVEANVFVQRRDLNRGWSEEGKLFREMESFCVSNPGTFCFCRPLYADQSAKPAFIEFGILKGDDFWVEIFDNRKEVKAVRRRRRLTYRENACFNLDVTSINHLSAQQLRHAADLKDKIDALENELARLLGSSAKSASGKAPKKKGGMSAAGRAAVAEAQRARWAKVNAGKSAAKTVKAPKKRRKMSAAGRARIAAAAKRRWAKAKADGKTRL
ncbi:MAG TPA: hypothetical protein VG347_19100 [Verrucomicrobiae bacterium]|nr:hypothetical protein [Verrucomicrobiae bacterium]